MGIMMIWCSTDKAFMCTPGNPVFPVTHKKNKNEKKKPTKHHQLCNQSTDAWKILPVSLRTLQLLTCLPPSFGLCWAPLLAPAQLQALQALQAPLVLVGAPGPDAHHQPCSHLKEEARQLSQGGLGGRCTVDYTLNTLQHKQLLWLDSKCVSHWYRAKWEVHNCPHYKNGPLRNLMPACKMCQKVPKL